MVASNGFLYVAGGTESGNPNEATAIVERYCIANDQWEDVSSMINNSSEFDLVESNGFLYAIGGNDEAFPYRPIEKYDPRTDRWKEVATTRYDTGYSSTVLDGRIYIAGVYGCEVYDPQERLWTTMSAPDNQVGGRRLCVLNGKLFSTGGESAENEMPVANTEYFDFEQGKWIPGKDMDDARSHHLVAVVTKATSSIIPQQ